MAGKKELMDKIETVTSERQEARAKLLGVEGKIAELTDELGRKDEMLELIGGEVKRLRKMIDRLMSIPKRVDFGVVVVDIPQGLSKEKTDELLKPVQDRMNEQMKSIGVDMPVIIMPGSVKSFDTYMIDSVKKVEQ